MCGIAGFYFFDKNEHIDQEKLINALILGIDSRGGHACGFSAFDRDGLIMIEKAACDAKDFMKGRRDLLRPAKYVLTHTRFATQGHQGFMKNNHPVVNNGVHVTHNGHIMNDNEIFKQVGWEKRLAEVDTEAIPAIVATEGWENWTQALEALEGGMAVAMAHEEHPGELILAKGEMSPLVYYATPRLLMWASTKGCLMSAWRMTIGKPPMADKIKELRIGEALHITPNGVTEHEWSPKRSNYSKWISWDDNISYYSGATSNWEESDWYKDNDGKWKKRGWRKTENGVWVQDVKELTAGRAEGNVSGLDAGALALVEGAEAITAEIEKKRKRADEIIHIENWWEDDVLRDEHIHCWEVVRQLREELEDAAWEAINQAIDMDEEDAERVEIICPSCYSLVPLADMDHIQGMDELYCQDCTDAWNSWLDEEKD